METALDCQRDDERRIAQAVAAERARCAKVAREMAARHRAASEKAANNCHMALASRHREAAAACEEIAAAIERGEG